MHRYAIADWLSPEQKQAICAARYEYEHPMAKRPLADGAYCPLGVLYRDGLADYCMNPSAPDGEAFALQYSRAVKFLDTPMLRQVTASAQAFIDDWDAGRIPPADLAIALGIEP